MPSASSQTLRSGDHPLRRLWRYATGHRRPMVWAAIWTTLNKVADVAPELLIGVAIDVIVRGEASFVATLLGIEDRFSQLGVLAGSTWPSGWLSR